MINIEGRKKLAQALRSLISGSITNLQFDDLDFGSKNDPAIDHIWLTAWGTYDDFHEHPLRLTEGQVSDFKRCIIFLHTDLEFEWADIRPWVFRFFSGLSNFIMRIFGIRPEDPTAHLDMAVWPFGRKEDYERALNSPELLTGKNSEQDVTANSLHASRSILS